MGDAWSKRSRWTQACTPKTSNNEIESGVDDEVVVLLAFLHDVVTTV